ncbi:transglutaminase family protein [Burkholderia oklahomensis]|uniref:Transglutaminase-like superfamily protein n=1 Tax=Burkholderia oklahomensis TaxID=342113 RepID=A0AAI8FRG7_9BURK|nr:transglutaminase family protein [Burkholderia oklahomensis]AIO70020.1 transglutaminase-like superfamily protein [Burkholderia oklahomensis]AOI39896.1 transglutaminase [Burkholderia oklahomensis EO147]KUY51884.1 transglutaminase [Burkholderia oklahomensis EO147]QPS39742.1 transglutaminase family protein [Burkholderia oklahomensis]
MRLAIRHISRFQFDEHAAYVLQRLRLRPQSGPCQTVRAWQVTIDGVEPTLGYADGLGNRVDLVRHERDKPEITIVAAGVVETQDRAGILGNVEGYAPPWIFERETDLTRAGDAVRALADALPIENKSLDALHWLMTEVHSRIAYAPGAQPAPRDAETALQSGVGTSRDHAHVFVAAARALRIPARYVSGYLLTDSSMQRIAEALHQASGVAQQAMQMRRDSDSARETPDDAAGQPIAAMQDAAVATQPQSGHAWAEAYIEGLGWVGFDPFMNRCPDERYVRIAAGLDYRDTIPVYGPGAKPLGVEISVIQSPELV